MKLSSFEMFKDMADQQGVIFYYEGEFSANVIAAMGDAVRHKLEQESVTGGKKRKIFSSFVEMSQNVAHYAAPRMVDGVMGGGFGSLVVGRKGENYFIAAGNYVHAEHVARMREKLEPLRRMTQEEIKQAYKAQLRNDGHEQDAVSKGAGLGFLTVARDASQPIDYSIVETTENGGLFAYFYLHAVI